MSETSRQLRRPLDLLNDFPAVLKSDWDAMVQKDLRGGSYEKRLVWKTGEGIAVQPYYRSGDSIMRFPLLRGVEDGWEIIAPGSEPALNVDTIRFHEEGATSVQEVAFALAQGADLLASDSAATVFGFAVGSNFFIEIAKLRAIRLLWNQVTLAFGLGQSTIRVHIRTANENKTLYDPYMNLLRVTTEAMSAIIGGCDSLTIAPCRFDAHLAENVHHLLREESRLGRVMDPGAGSYSVEALTDQIAGEAWNLFQQIESAGGFAKYRAAGDLIALIAGARESREGAFAARRRVLVGVNNYPNVQERALDEAGQMQQGWRAASAFEKIRLRTERYEKAGGRTPRVLLLEYGDLKMRKARSAFCLNFFGCAGFEIKQSDTLIEADLVVLCSSDAEYLSLARETCPKVKVPVVVAGNIEDQIEALKAAGISGFVHAASNLIETLSDWQNRLGLKEEIS
jgi:methylmalonyl-CoA mutase